MLAPLDNETIFKKAFTDKEVFQHFIKDLFDVDIKVGKIETEKKFDPPVANIDIKIDLFAETEDHRFIVEIQKIDYDYNFNRFLNYFITVLLEQQRRGEKYKIPQTVLGVVVITRPYIIDQLTGEPIKENVMSIDFDPRNLKDERVRIFNHKLLFLNPHPKYANSETPKNIKNWLDLFRLSINNNMKITLDLTNKGIAKTIKLIEYENLDAQTANDMKIAESKKAMLSLVKSAGKKEGLEEGFDKGIEKGIGQGRHYEKIDVAIEMIKDGEPIEKIIRYTKLSKEIIENLIKELNNK